MAHTVIVRAEKPKLFLQRSVRWGRRGDIASLWIAFGLERFLR